MSLLSSAGTVNAPGNPVQWTKLRGVPEGLADGADNAGPDAMAAYCALARANPHSYPDAPCRLRVESVDTGSRGTAIAIGTNGNPVIAFTRFDGSNYPVMVATCNDRSCASRDLGVWGLASPHQPSMAIGTAGNPVLTYQEGAAGYVEGGSGREFLDSVGYYNSTAIGSDGRPVISYAGPGDSGGPAFDLKFARCTDATCTDVVKHTLDVRGTWTSIAIGTDGNPVISYGGAGNTLKIARCADLACASSTLNTVDTVHTDGNVYTSIAIGLDGNPLVTYRGADGALKVARCGDPACGTSTLYALDTAGAYTSVAIGTDGNPVVSYTGSGNVLKVARCTDPACAGATLHTFDTAGFLSSIAVGADGNPVVSYRGSGDTLKVARAATSD